MNLLLLFEDDFIEPTRVQITGRRADHIIQVIDPEVGSKLMVGQLNGLVGEGVVVDRSVSKVLMEVQLNKRPVASLPVVLLMALPRPKSLFKSLQLATTMGVKQIHFYHSYKVEKAFWQSKRLSDSAIREHLYLGLEQSKDTMLPEVFLHPYFKPFVEDVVPGLIRGKDCFVSHPGSVGSYCPYRKNSPTVLALGPEGGLIDYEVEKFEEQGFGRIHLGERILRVEQALPVLLGKMFD